MLNRVIDYLLGIILLVLYLNIVSAKNGLKTRIVGGQTTDISEVRYLVQVLRSTTLCGGSLIRPRWVLTAAHCAHGFQPSEFTIIAGTSYFQGTQGTRRRVTNIFVAPLFTSEKLNMDAALLKLRAPMTGSNIHPISLADNVLTNVPIRVAGWGRITEGGDISYHLLSTRIPVSKTAECTRRYAGFIHITDYMFCAYEAGRDTCSGDSGGSAVQNGRLAGIASFGAGCARPGYPGVYTKVSEIKPWVLRTIRNNND